MVPTPSDSVIIASLVSGAIISIGFFTLVGYIAKLYFTNKKTRVPGSAKGTAYEKVFSDIYQDAIVRHNKPPDKTVIMD